MELQTWLLERGVDLGATKTGGWTAMHTAAEADKVEVLEYLLEQGATVAWRSADGTTPLHVAALFDASSAAAFLIERGADVNARNTSGQTPLTVLRRQGEPWRDVEERLARRRALERTLLANGATE